MTCLHSAGPLPSPWGQSEYIRGRLEPALSVPLRPSVSRPVTQDPQEELRAARESILSTERGNADKLSSLFWGQQWYR